MADHVEYGERTCFSAYEYPKKQKNKKINWVDIYDEHN